MNIFGKTDIRYLFDVKYIKNITSGDISQLFHVLLKKKIMYPRDLEN